MADSSSKHEEMAVADLDQAQRQLIAEPGDRQHADDDAGGAGNQNEVERTVSGLDQAHSTSWPRPRPLALEAEDHRGDDQGRAIAHITAFSGW